MFIEGRKVPVDLEGFVSGSDSADAEEGWCCGDFLSPVPVCLTVC